MSTRVEKLATEADWVLTRFGYKVTLGFVEYVAEREGTTIREALEKITFPYGPEPARYDAPEGTSYSGPLPT